MRVFCAGGTLCKMWGVVTAPIKRASTFCYGMNIASTAGQFWGMEVDLCTVCVRMIQGRGPCIFADEASQVVFNGFQNGSFVLGA
eukprot:2113692-Amphidinium_carterae.1